MPELETPQFDLPFRLNAAGSDAVMVEQDSAEDVADSVETLLRTPLGWFEENPDYGVIDGTFDEGRVDVNEIHTAISQWEPRADVQMGASIDSDDFLSERIAAFVAVRSND
jgi:phage baseplate assembly protein W